MYKTFSIGRKHYRIDIKRFAWFLAEVLSVVCIAALIVWAVIGIPANATSFFWRP